MAPALERAAEVDADELAEDTGVDALGVVGGECARGLGAGSDGRLGHAGWVLRGGARAG